MCFLMELYLLLSPPKEKERLYVELKQILARQPGPEAAEQLQQCRWTIREKNKKHQVNPHNFFSLYCSCCLIFGYVPVILLTIEMYSIYFVLVETATCFLLYIL